jgi:site-specific DNA-methyltransferase (adenine-specific)
VKRAERAALKPAESGHELRHGDCRLVLPELRASSVRLVYLDPPFFTQRVQRLGTRDRTRSFEFADLWSGQSEYAAFLHACLTELRRVLAADGSLFFHCDRRASHLARALLDQVFGARQFRAEIIWQYRRWSNAQRALLPAHQTIFHYSKGPRYVFHPMYVEYSPATNVDQITQRRTRDPHGKAVYARDGAGRVLSSGAKKGVPLGDVWDIPYLNPKAKERVGYPTQKPVLLLERILRLASDPGDLVLDPCCGSGTTLVAAALLGRRSLGIDSSQQALALARQRLEQPMKTESLLLERGREAYREADAQLLQQLGDLELVPVQRNRGMDALLRAQVGGRPVALRVQRAGESLEHAAALLERAGRAAQCRLLVLVARAASESGEPRAGDPGARPPRSPAWPEHLVVIESIGAQVEQALARFVLEC